MTAGIKVCTIGGGSGMPIVNQALVRAGYRDISSIVTTFDSGGDTGRMRTDERGKILAYSDYWRSLISLWDNGRQKTDWEEMLRFRDGRGRNFGNIFFQFMSEKTGDLSHVDRLFSQLTGAKLLGNVIPVSREPSEVCFTTITGKEYRGEHHLDDLRMSMDVVTRIWLNPEVRANYEAIEALEQADIIIVGPGSTYGSLLTNFLPQGMKDAFNRSSAKKILLANIMLSANENGDGDVGKYIAMFEEYLGASDAFDKVVVADLEGLDKSKMEKIMTNYRLEHAKPLVVNGEYKGVEKVDLAVIEEKNMRLRHSVEKLAQYLLQLVHVPEKTQEVEKVSYRR